MCQKRLLWGQVVGNLWILPLTTVLSVIWLFVSINGDFDHQWILGISLESHLYKGALSFLIRIAVLVGFKECAGWTLYIIIPIWGAMWDTLRYKSKIVKVYEWPMKLRDVMRPIHIHLPESIPHRNASVVQLAAGWCCSLQTLCGSWKEFAGSLPIIWRLFQSSAVTVWNKGRGNVRCHLPAKL